MANIVIRFIGDTSGLRGLLQSIGQETNAFVSRTNAASQLTLQRQLGLPSSKGLGNQTGSFVTALKTEIDSYNKVLRTTGEVQLKVFKGLDRKGQPLFTEQTIAEAEAYHGNLDRIITAQEKYSESRQRLSAAESEALVTGRALAQDISDRTSLITKENVTRGVSTEKIIADAKTRLPLISQEIAETKKQLKVRDDLSKSFVKPLTGAAATKFQTKSIALEERLSALQKERLQLGGRVIGNQQLLNRLNDEAGRIIAADPTLNTLKGRYNAYQQAQGILLGGLRKDLVATGKAVEAAKVALPPVPTNIETLRTRYKGLFAELQRFGLGQLPGGAAASEAQLGAALYAQQTKISAPIKNLTTGFTTFRGGFINPVTREQQEFSAEVDSSGRVVTKFGGQLSGLGRVLQQTARNFQKVVEWTVATTFVFGGLAAVTKTIQSIIVLDKSLQQFAITAQLSSIQAKSFFNVIADVAFRTATPLAELLKSADDIALAMRKAGQSAGDWQKSIVQLTQSVGILTNLAGIDTVKATDLLVSTVKQLNITAEDTPRLLAKITAVAGGQSTSIADIVQGLGTLAEASEQAGLSIDQMISTVQVLSQVTAKTPSEVAVSLKNLMGSIDSAGAVRALKEFGISVRDEAGNLKPFLEVYKEISAAISSGIIPTGRVKDVVKGIAGGPRRAPDAAALLAALSQIFQVEERSINASNEALIANQKILDTTAAKVTQLGVLFTQATFQKFAGTLNSTLNTVITVATALLQVFSAIPSELVTIVAGLLALSLAGKGITGLFSTISRTQFLGFLPRLADNLFLARKALIEFSNAELLAANRSLGLTSIPTRLGNLGKVLGALSGGKALLGLTIGTTAIAGLVALSQQSNKTQEDVSGLASTLTGIGGWVALGAFPALGAVLLGVSAGFSLLGENARKSREEMEAQAETVRQATAAYKDTSTRIGDLKEQQRKLLSEINNLKNSQDGSTESYAALIDAEKQYGNITSQLIDANSSLAESFHQITLNMPGLAESYGLLITQAKAGLLSVAETEKLLKDITAVIAKSRGLTLPTEALLPTRPKPEDIKSLTGSTQAFTTDIFHGIFTPKLVADISSFAKQPELVTRLFSPDGTRLIADFEFSTQNLLAVQDALGITFKNNTSALDLYNRTLNEAIIGTNSATGAEYRYNQILANLDAQVLLGKNQDIVKIQKERAKIAELLEFAASQAKDVNQARALQALANQQFGPTGAPLEIRASVEEALKIGKAINSVGRFWDDIINDPQAFAVAVHEYLVNQAGADIEGLVPKIGAASAAFDDFFESLKSGSDTVLSDLSTKLLDLQASFQAGDINAKDFEKQRKALLSQVDALNAFNAQFDKSTEVGKAFAENYDKILPILSKLPGFLDATTWSADNFTQKLFDVIFKLGLTGAQTEEVIKRLVALALVMDKIDGLVATITVQLKTVVGPQTRKEKELANLETGGINSIWKEIEAWLKKGKPPSSGRGGGGGPNVGLLDLPEEIANAVNRDALIKEAIKRATALQSKIPGATKEAKNDIVELLQGTQRILEVRHVKEELLRKALEELADIEKKKLDFETKADTIRRIRVGAGDFSAIANVPMNAATGVSVGGPQGPITVNLGISGQILTPAQFDQLANKIASYLKRQIAAG